MPRVGLEGMQPKDSALQLSRGANPQAERDGGQLRAKNCLLLDSYGTYKLLHLCGPWFALFICEMRSGTCQALG